MCVKELNGLNRDFAYGTDFIFDFPPEASDSGKDFTALRSLTVVHPVWDASVVMVIESCESVFIRGQVIGSSLVISAIRNDRTRFCILFCSLFVKDGHADRTRNFCLDANVLDAELSKVHGAAAVLNAFVLLELHLNISLRVLEKARIGCLLSPHWFRTNLHGCFGKNGTVFLGKQRRGAGGRDYLRPDTQGVRVRNPVP